MDPYGFTRRIKVSRKSSQIPKPIIHFVRKSIRPIKTKKNNSIQSVNRNKLKKLSLCHEKIWEREEVPDAPAPLLWTYYALCNGIDLLYPNNPINRFWFLETVARMPYFSYVSILHFYETMGWWSIDNKLREEHTKEDINEGNHLLIMESLGGGTIWKDQLLARHTAILYYMVLIVLYLLAPRTAYKSSEMLEMHAVATYEEFLEQNQDLLKELPAPFISQKIYGKSVENLYQIFWLISYDERKHANLMRDLTS